LAFDLHIASRLFTGLCDLHFLTAVMYEENKQVLIKSTVSKGPSPEYLKYICRMHSAQPTGSRVPQMTVSLL